MIRQHMTPKQDAQQVHRAMPAAEHTQRARELLAAAKLEADGQRALALIRAASLHTRYADEKTG